MWFRLVLCLFFNGMSFGVQFRGIMRGSRVLLKNNAVRSVAGLYKMFLLVSVSQNSPTGATNSRYEIPVYTTTYRFHSSKWVL
jgi:hypothetical protein